MILTIIIVFISIISLMALHEFGHFIVAKRFGVKVEEFGIGYPPRLFGKKIGETLYSLNLIPFGAFVRIPGADGQDETIENSRAFQKKPIWQRALILLGGAVSFWLVAAVLLTIVFLIGAPQTISDTEAGPLINSKVQVLSVVSGSPAEEAGIKVGDAIKQFKVAGQELLVSTVAAVQEMTEEYGGEAVVLVIERGTKLLEISLTPRVSPPSGEGPIGVALVRTAEKSYSLWQSLFKGVEATFNLTQAVVLSWWQILQSLLGGEGLPKGVEFVGPIGIGSLIYQAARIGLNYFLQFIAIISIYLAVFNILPIPALDGGKLLFLGIEKLRGRPVGLKLEQRITTFFFALLIIIMVFVSIKDISRFF